MGAPYLDLEKTKTADGFKKTGFIPAGSDPTNELGDSVGMDEKDNILYIQPGGEHHLEPVPISLKNRIEWKC